VFISLFLAYRYYVQASAVGAQGFKFAGMSADMLLKVNEYALGLRDGSIELPPQPTELIKENRRLKDELHIMFTKLQNYEVTNMIFKCFTLRVLVLA